MEACMHLIATAEFVGRASLKLSHVYGLVSGFGFAMSSRFILAFIRKEMV